MPLSSVQVQLRLEEIAPAAMRHELQRDNDSDFAFEVPGVGHVSRQCLPQPPAELVRQGVVGLEEALTKSPDQEGLGNLCRAARPEL